ncbi:PIN domain-containing protein [Candidatus Poriferisodalis sp.]|uniref:PIN domain-containing protein n=1 Tax=Candidatus Poriferisodalis sp. TaxID=3101277 RepID=UPI003B02AEBF
MTAIDTNVLVRFLVNDDPEQAAAARDVLARATPAQPVFVCREVVAETVWVLERAYRLSRSRIADILMDLVAAEEVAVETADDVAQAVGAYRRGSAGFADLMILAASQRVGAQPLLTLDRQLAALPGAALVA